MTTPNPSTTIIDAQAAPGQSNKGDIGMNKTNLTAEPGKQDIVLTRLFDAPRELLFRAFTDPELRARWWGPRRYTTVVDKMDVRPGGAWRFINRDKEGNEFRFPRRLPRRSIPERLVFTFEYEGMPGHVLLETVTLKSQNGKTLLTDQSVFQSLADRDGMLQSGMESGANESMDRLDELVASL